MPIACRTVAARKAAALPEIPVTINGPRRVAMVRTRSRNAVFS
ncbi:hypothetical protein DSCOOX_65270 [Desulfosarcina ovata subsp. ovata]|uniref:Uncharacterized protein n=1 Tax=Desulfosarcina ovata subsp. ovata TaxID=2752305 RepID=A0A5K8AKT4_9BACT|nr:hypothetical protein DSCOOX_65270 [Desulfosarcina ovata subsp. ovata]